MKLRRIQLPWKLKKVNEDAEKSPSELISVTTRRPVAILMIAMAICVFGWVSYQRLSLDLMPDISYPTLSIRTEYLGTAPEEVEMLLSRPLEQAVGVVPNLVNLSSISRAGQSDIILEFQWDTDMNVASQNVREKADRIFLPQGAKKPLLLRYDPSLDPIMRIGLNGPQDLYELRNIAEYEIKRALESLRGVAAVKIKGGFEEEIHVALNERQIAILGLNINQINSSLAQNNVNLPGGNLREGQVEYLIRTLNEFQSLDEIGELIISRKNGANILLRDIAEIYRAYKDRQIITRMNGIESIELEIFKEADANVVAVAERVSGVLYGLPAQREYLEGKEEREDAEEVRSWGRDSSKQDKGSELARELNHQKMTDFISFRLPKGAELKTLSDQSIFIQNSINEVRNSAIIGCLFAICVLFLFLRNVVHTFIIGLTIPISIVATFAPMFLFDVSLNIMSLGGLALGVGMLVDNSIVVLESIFRCREEGDSLVRATIRGASEVGSAVFASTLTTITVFFPIIFVEGVAGQVFGDMALTVVFSLIASLCVALFVIPMLASRQLAGTGLGDNSFLGEDSDFLCLSVWNHLRTATNKEVPVSTRFIKIFLSVPYLFYETMLRFVLAASTCVVVLLKAVFLILLQTIMPIFLFYKLTIGNKKPSMQGKAIKWAESGCLGSLKFFERVWPGLLVFYSNRNLVCTLSNFSNWQNARKSRSLRVIIHILWVPILFYVYTRFILGVFLRVVGNVARISFLLIGLSGLFLFSFVAILLVPLLAPFLFVFENGFSFISNLYPKALRWALGFRIPLILCAIVLLFYCWNQLVPKIGQELIPEVYQGEFNLDVTLPVGTPLERTAAILYKIEEIVSADKRVERTATTIGFDGSANSASDAGEHTSKITAKLESDAQPEDEIALINDLRERLEDVPEVNFEISRPALFSFKTPVEVEIRGNDLRELRRLSRRAEETLREVPGLVDVRSSLQVGNPELQIKYKRDRLANYGLRLRDVAELVRNKIQGTVPTDFRNNERQIDVLVRLQEQDRLGITELEGLIVNPNGSVPIPLSAVAEIFVDEGPSEIRRIDQQRAALITANIEGIDLGKASERIYLALNQMTFPVGFDFFISGQNEEMKTSLSSLYYALLLAIFLVYVVMASQFESLTQPLVIMFTVPFALIGVIIALYWAKLSISIVVFIGIIMLAGIVVNNAIVLVDYINKLRRDGLSKIDAIVDAGSARLRPIIMTTMTTVLGLLPMALGIGDGAEIRTPMALTVIAGLISSTLLTLIMIPVVYSFFDRSR
ncbi:MAG: efflux RND transporter permease subunit [Candidatus Latescibacterota bacterium]|nr:efflux RND transporter permease subunit [Candidatus Latescibacterota bacterium]